MRLLTTVRSKTPALQQRGPHPCSEQGCTRPVLRGDGFAGKRLRRNGPSSPERVRLLQPLLPRPQKGWRPMAHPRSQNPHETAVQDDYVETDPLANMPRVLVIFPGSERCLLSHPDSPSPQAILEICLRGCDLSVHGPALWTVPGSPNIYEVHGHGPFPSKTDGNPHSQLPRRLVRSLPVSGGIVVAQIPPSQPLGVPGTQGQLCQERTVSQPRILFLGTVFDSAQMRAAVTPERALAIQRLPASFATGASRPLKLFQRMLGLMASSSPVLQLGLICMRPLQCWLKPRVPSDAWHH